MPKVLSTSRQGGKRNNATNPMTEAVRRIDRRSLARLAWAGLGATTLVTGAIVTTAVVKAGSGGNAIFSGPGGIGISITGKDGVKDAAGAVDRLGVLVEALGKSSDTSSIREAMRRYPSTHSDYRELEARIDRIEAQRQAMLQEAGSIVARLREGADPKPGDKIASR